MRHARVFVKKICFFFLLASYLRSSIHARETSKGKKRHYRPAFWPSTTIESQDPQPANSTCLECHVYHVPRVIIFSSHSSSTPDIENEKFLLKFLAVSIDYFTSSTRKIITVFRYSWTQFNNIYIFFWSCVITWHDWPTCTWFAFIVVIKSIVQSCYSFHKKRT